MKMKQKLAATLAGVMAVSMVPATSVFAASDNRVTNQVVTPVSTAKSTDLVITLKDKLKTNDTFILKSTKAYVKGVSAYDATYDDKSTANNKVKFWKTDSNGDWVDFTQAEDTVVKLTSDYTRMENGQSVTYSAGTPISFKGVKSADLPDVSKFVYLYDGSSTSEVQVKYLGSGMSEGDELTIPFEVKDSKAGDASVVIDAYGTSITSEEIKLGTVVAKGITATLTKQSNFKENKDYTTLQDIVLTETMAGMFGKKSKTGKVELSNGVDGYFTIRLSNSDARFVDFDEETWDEKNSSSYSAGGATKANIGSKTPVGTVYFEASLGAQGLLETTSAPAYVSDDGMSLYIPVPYLKSLTTSVGKITLDMHEIKLYKNRDDEDYIGKVEATLINKWSENGTTAYEVTQTVSKSGDFILVDDVEQLVTFTPAASPATATVGRQTKVTAIKVKEDAVGSIDKEVSFSFPEGTKVIGVTVSKNSTDGDWDKIYVNGADVKALAGSYKNEDKVFGYDGSSERTIWSASTGNTVEGAMSRIYRPEVTITFDEDRDRLVDMTVTFTLEVSGDYEDEEIEVICESTVSETYEKVETPVVVANTRKAVTVKAESKVIDENYKKQEVGDIVITEAFKGALTAGKKVVLELEEGVGFLGDYGTRTVTEGDIEIGRLKYINKDDDGHYRAVEFTVSTASTVPSEIVISGLAVSTVDVAGGYYSLRVYGAAIADNDILVGSNTVKDSNGNYYSESKLDKIAKGDFDEFNAGGALIEDFIAINRELLSESEKANSVTNKTETIIITIPDGSTTCFRNDGKTYEIVAPTYRPVDGVTMIPLRAICELLGVSTENVEYAPESKTVTITMNDGSYAQVTLNSTTATDINGRTVIMNYKAEIPEGKDGSIYVPLRYFGRLLGIADDNIKYDTATKSVVISYEKLIK